VGSRFLWRNSSSVSAYVSVAIFSPSDECWPVCFYLFYSIFFLPQLQRFLSLHSSVIHATIPPRQRLICSWVSPFHRLWRPLRRVEVQLYFIFVTSALEGGEGSASHPGRTLPLGKTRYPLYRRLGWPHGRSRQVRKISPPPGFDPQTVQLVGSRYTDYATRRNLFVRQNIYLLSNSPRRWRL
jgi:hypothetical protein